MITEMLAFARGSRIFRHGLGFFIKPPPLYPTSHHLSAFELNYAQPFKLYHSVTKINKVPEFSMPREDYTRNQDVAMANYTVSMLCREGKIAEARQLFDELSERDVVSWSAIISGYVKCGLIEKARELFDRVDAKRNVVTWTAMISGYLKMREISEAETLFSEMPDKNVVSWNTMLDGYVRCNRVDQALRLFAMMEEKNVVSWNMVISGLVNCGRVEEAKGFFDRMPIRNVVSWTTMISGLAQNKRVDEARLLFDQMPVRNVVSWNAMITGYAQNSKLHEAYDLFTKMQEKDIQSWNAMITGFIHNKDLETARKLFNQMPVQNVISWTTMVTGYAWYGRSEEALKIFSIMIKDNKVRPNERTFATVLGACSDLAGLSEGMQVHQVVSKTPYQTNGFVIAALINMYSKCGELLMAKGMFDDGLSEHRDLVFWNTMIIAYAHHGCGTEAINTFEEMQKAGLKPNDVSYVGLLSACNHAGLLQEGLNYFELLHRDKYIKIREDHYTCVVDLYGRAGRLKEAFDLVEQLPWKASGHVWGTLLSACHVHGNADVGKLVMDKISDLKSASDGTYMLVSSIYATNGKWKDAEILKLKMKDKGLKKQPGCSWIEVGNKSHVFIVGDRSHRETESIHSLLFNIHKKMKKIGHTVMSKILMEANFW